MSLRSISSRVRVVLSFLVLAILALAVAAAVSDTSRNPDKLIILSTTDVKGKTSPCG